MDDQSINLISAIASSAGAVTGMLTVVGGTLGAVLTLRRRRKAEENRWHLDLGMRLPEGYRGALVREGDERAFLIKAVEVISPDGALISNRGAGDGCESLARRIEPNTTIRQRLRYRREGEAYIDPGLLYLLVTFPPRPRKSRITKVRLRISVTAEEVSASRRQIRIKVTSQEIAWIARKTDIQA